MKDPKPNHRIAVSAIGCSALVLVAYLCTRAFNKSADTVTGLFDKAIAVSSKFKTGTITSTFNEQLARVSGTGGDVLELATSLCEESTLPRIRKVTTAPEFPILTFLDSHVSFDSWLSRRRCTSISTAPVATLARANTMTARRRTVWCSPNGWPTACAAPGRLLRATRSPPLT